ncbi:hypothetical protein EDC04DRAFT_2978598 [Pisolithus marmoratus]|nr:hypothetical protein EDC04DRAFT_2978598 [Pisolithus marmoratus]
MSSPNKLTEHADDSGVDLVLLSDLVAFLSGLSLNQMTADAAIQEIQAWACPSMFGMPPCLPTSFPVSPLSSRDSTSSRVQAFYPTSLYMPALSPSPAHHSSATVHTNSTSSVPSMPKSGLLAFTTVFGNTKVISSSPSRFEVVPETLQSLGVIGNPKLQTFILEMVKGENCWQQLYKGIYFDVPGPDVAGPLYLVTKGTQIGIHSECYTKGSLWPRTVPYVIHIKGSCFVTVSTVEEGV